MTTVKATGYAVETFDAENTGLAGVVFATKQEAERAAKACKSVYAGSKFEVIETQSEANTTFDKWNEAGW